MFKLIGSGFIGFTTYLFDLFGLVSISLKASFELIHKSRRQVFWHLFKRQIWNTGVRALYVNAVLATLIGIAIITKIKEFAEGGTFGEIYANLFIIIIVREFGPLISGIVLIARSAPAITAEIGYLKLSDEFSTLRDQGINPIYLLLLPTFYAFPISLVLMFIYFDFISIISAYTMIWFMDPTISFIGFTAGILEKFTLSEFTITLLKGLIGGGMIGLVSIYFGSKVSQKFSDLPRAISNATTSQLVMFFLINVSLSVLAYR